MYIYIFPFPSQDISLCAAVAGAPPAFLFAYARGDSLHSHHTLAAADAASGEDQALHTAGGGHALHTAEGDHVLHTAGGGQELHTAGGERALHIAGGDQALHTSAPSASASFAPPAVSSVAPTAPEPTAGGGSKRPPQGGTTPQGGGGAAPLIAPAVRGPEPTPAPTRVRVNPNHLGAQGTFNPGVNPSARGLEPTLAPTGGRILDAGLHGREVHALLSLSPENPADLSKVHHASIANVHLAN